MADGYIQQALPVYLRRLGELWLQLRQDKERAHGYLLAALKEDAQEAKAFALYWQTVEGRPLPEIMQEIGDFYRDAAGREFLFRQALRLGAVELAEHCAQEAGNAMPRELAMWQLYAESRAAGPVALLQSMTAKILAKLEPLVLAAFAVGQELEDGSRRKLWEAAVAVLPREMQEIFWRWSGLERPQATEQPDAALLQDAYLSLLPLAMQQADAAGRQRYAQLAAELDPELRHKALERLVALAYWEEALALLGTVEADSADADAGFWQQAGIVFYRLERLEEAAGAFAMAEQLGGTDFKGRAFYLQELQRRGYLSAGEEV